MSIPALSLHQPWASAVVCGLKNIETRSRRINYRGPLAIAATATEPRECRNLMRHFQNELVLSLGEFEFSKLPRGVVLGVRHLIDVVPVEDLRDSIADTEYMLGDYSNGRFAWVFGDCERFEAPYPCKGGQFIWRWKRPT